MNLETPSFSPLFTEDNFILISALQHYIFCPRQCALIHVEDVWRENLFTVRGAILHEKVDTDTYETRGPVRTVRGLRVHSFRYGITGRIDVVEIHTPGNAPAERFAVPVEFKSGKPKQDISDSVQLCAQAFCLEEMLNIPVPYGMFYYGRIKRRVKAELDPLLRKQTAETIASVHALVKSGKTPTAEYSAKCRYCSLLDVCMPKAMNSRKQKRYFDGLYAP